LGEIQNKGGVRFVGGKGNRHGLIGWPESVRERGTQTKRSNSSRVASRKKSLNGKDRINESGRKDVFGCL